MKFIKSVWFKLLIPVFLIIILILIIRALDIDISGITKDNFKAKVESFGIWGPIVYIIVYVLRPLILFPAGLISISAGFIWGFWKGLLYVQIAANLSSAAEFFIARYFARDMVKRLIKGKIAKIDESVEKHGFLTVFLIRLIPNVAWDIQNLSLGLTRVRSIDYLLATLIGIIPGSAAFVAIGAFSEKALISSENVWMIGMAIAIFIGVFYLQKYLRKKYGQKIK